MIPCAVLQVQLYLRLSTAVLSEWNHLHKIFTQHTDTSQLLSRVVAVILACLEKLNRPPTSSLIELSVEAWGTIQYTASVVDGTKELIELKWEEVGEIGNASKIRFNNGNVSGLVKEVHNKFTTLS